MTDAAPQPIRARSIGATLLGVLAGLIFLVSLTLHFLTYLPHPSVSMDWAWPIHVSIFIPFGAMVIMNVMATRMARTDKNQTQTIQRRIEKAKEASDRWAELRKRMMQSVPPRVKLLGVALLVLALVNFVVCLGLLEGASPVEDDGRYYLSNHGDYVRELTLDEYRGYQAYEVRFFSGLWLVFSYVPLVYFVFIHHRVRDYVASLMPTDLARNEKEPSTVFERRGKDTHCKKCGFELVGPGGPCRRCDDVKTKPCSSCGLHILVNDKTCPYCGATDK